MEIIHKISLNITDIEAAIGLFLQANNIDISQKRLNITLTTGRKGGGTYANITLDSVAPEPKEMPMNDPKVAPVDMLTDISEEPNVSTDEEMDDTEEETLDAVTHDTETITKKTDSDLQEEYDNTESTAMEDDAESIFS